ncbi:Polysaccharide biosynthesis protein [Mammaliicoccus lentus]|uniref:oligosaccharide flippase family protein n=1 Tax=Mammaliicoccus lentus TaxID=42858 RepID=UPI00085CBF91|nr:oligosaccharide flippase family protein [Mammaliicoccus lentus]SCT97446.1 Polysaccharide biosynthesis protein [Mammaliicoccus lentus]
MIKDSILYFISKFVPSIISFITIFIFLKLMDAEDYGRYSIIIITLGLINIISSQWLRSSMIRFFHENSKILNTIITIQIIIIIILSILNVVFLNLIGSRIEIVICTTILLINLIIFEFLNNYYRTLIKPGIVLIGNLLRNIFFVGTLLIIINYKYNVSIVDALVSFTIGLIAANIYLLYFYKFNLSFNINKNYVKKISIYGLPLTISFALGVLLQNIDKYMITYMINVKSNGNYSLVYDFIHNSLYMVIGSLGMASLPRIIKQSNNKFNKLEFNKYVELLYIVSIPLTFAFISISEDLSKVIRSYGYETSTNIIVLIIIATMIHGTNSFVYGQAIQLMQNTKVIYIPSIIAILVNVLLNIILLPNIGVLGAAISTLIAFIFSNYSMYRISIKNSGIIYFPSILFKTILIGICILIIINSITISNSYFSIIIKGSLSIILQVLIIIFYKKRKEHIR